MNNVDSLIKGKFSTLPLEQKLEIKRLGPHQPVDFNIVQAGKDKTRSFNPEWFKRKTWLTACVTRKSLFCLPCLLFGGDTTWTTVGFKDLKHLSERLAKHESSGSHVENSLKLGLLGTANIAVQLDSAHKRAIELHNQHTEENRYVLGRIITCLKLCGKCEIALRGRDESAASVNPGIFRSIFETMCEGDSRLKRHYESQPYFKGTSATIQNELLQCMFNVYQEEVVKQVSDTPFVTVQADETTDVSCKSQVVVVLRYMTGTTVKERFWRFIEVRDKTAPGLASAIQEAIEPLSLREKLIAQTYDGAAVMSGHIRGVQTLIREKYPNAQFVHCYAHQLNLTLQQVCATRISDLKVFFADLSAFATFFSNSPKRTAALSDTSARRIPRPAATRWNFKSRTVNAVWENRADIMKCLDNIRTEPGWDSVTIREAYGLAMYLEDDTFLQFLQFFYQLMPEVDILYNTLQKRSVDATTVNRAMDSFKDSVSRLREKVDDIAQERGAAPKKRRKKNTAAVMMEACDTVVAQVEERFCTSDHLIAAQLVDSTLFSKFSKSFPCAEFEAASKIWPIGNKVKLETELKSLYSHSELHAGNTLSLLQLIYDNNLQDALSETVSLIKVIITTPMTTAESERNFSTLKRIKTFPRNTMGQQRLNALAMLSIENEFIHGLMDFDRRVIDKFAQMKDRRASFLFKK